MDAKRFDEFARALPIALPRRLAVGGALTASLAALLAGRPDEADARKKKRNKKRKKKNKCQADEIKCSGQCVNPRFDPNNCGFCGNSCPAGACLNGTCICRNSGECNGCNCAVRFGGGGACNADLIEESTCDSDADCPDLGSFCGQSGRCTISCKE